MNILLYLENGTRLTCCCYERWICTVPNGDITCDFFCFGWCTFVHISGIAETTVFKFCTPIGHIRY